MLNNEGRQWRGASKQKAMTVPEEWRITEYRLTAHAQLGMERRRISEAEIAQVLFAPEQREMVRPRKMVRQARVEYGEPARTYLLRVIVDVDRRPAEAVTAYRTGRLERYWRRES